MLLIDHKPFCNYILEKHGGKTLKIHLCTKATDNDRQQYSTLPVKVGVNILQMTHLSISRLLQSKINRR